MKIQLIKSNSNVKHPLRSDKSWRFPTSKRLDNAIISGIKNHFHSSSNSEKQRKDIKEARQQQKGAVRICPFGDHVRPLTG